MKQGPTILFTYYFLIPYLLTMFDFYERRRFKQYLYSWPAIVVLGFACLWLALSVWGVYTQERQTRITKGERQAYLEELQVREAALNEEIARLRTDRGIEEEIRQKFEVAKEGEEVIVIVDAPNQSGAEGAQEGRPFGRFLQALMFWR